MPTTVTYLVCCTQRSGSSLLCDLLHNTRLAGNPQEYFSREFEDTWAKRWHAYNFGAYLEAALNRTCTPNGVFGAKIMYEHVDFLTGNIEREILDDREPAASLLRAVLPNLHFIFIYRQNVVRQAVSHWRATQTAIWNDDGRARRPAGTAVYDFAAIDERVRGITLHNHCWRAFFSSNGIRPMEVTYEDLVPHPGETTRAILEFLGVRIPSRASFPGPSLRRQADSLSEEWVRRYEDERSARPPTSHRSGTRPSRAHEPVERTMRKGLEAQASTALTPHIVT